MKKSYAIEMKRESYITVFVEADNEDEAEVLAFKEADNRDADDYPTWGVESIEELFQAEAK